MTGANIVDIGRLGYQDILILARHEYTAEQDEYEKK